MAEAQQITHSDFATQPLGENESIQGASRQNPGAAGLSTEEEDPIALLGRKKDFQRFWDFLSFLFSFLFFSFLPNKTLTFSFSGNLYLCCELVDSKYLSINLF